MLGPGYDYVSVFDRVSDIWFDDNGEFNDQTQHEVLELALGYTGDELEALNLAYCDFIFALDQENLWERNWFGIFEIPNDADLTDPDSRKTYNVFCELGR